jgi:hypothetical protein
LQNGQYVDSVEEIDPTPTGAQATQGRYQVQWTGNANTAGGAVTLTTADNKTLISSVYGLAYSDTASGSNVMLAQLQDCTATIVGANVLVYSNAFNNLSADLRYTYRKAGLSQDVILRQQPPSPAVYGLNPATTRLQVLTEFFNPPAPDKATVINSNISDDRILNFGDMQMGVGNAFLFQSNSTTRPGASVGKHWTNLDNRTFLIEDVPYKAVSNLLSSLHASVIKPDKSKVRRTVSLDPPKPRKISSSKPTLPVKQAKATQSENAFVADYELLSGATNYFTFRCDTTYLITGLYNISATAVLEGGTTIKYTNNSIAEIETSNVVCETGPYRPAVFTSMNDDSVGAAISGSTGNPSSDYYGNVALSSIGTTTLQNVRFSHLATAISPAPYITSNYMSELGEWFYNATAILTMSDFQILNCQTAFYLASSDVPYTTMGYTLNNGLIYNIQSEVFEDDNAYGFVWQNFNGANLTIHNCADFETPASILVATFVNCLIVQATNIESELGSEDIPSALLPNPTTNTTVILDSDPGAFQTVGAASHYLAAGSSCQGGGTTDPGWIDPAIVADLRTKTTYPPNTNYVGWLTNNITFSNLTLRDTNATNVDIGYHYDTIDYAVNLAVSNAAVTVQPGTVLAGMGTNFGIQLYSNATFNCQGTATNPVCIVRYNTVQEQATNTWASTNWQASLVTTNGSGSASNSIRFAVWSVLGQDGQFSANDQNGVPFGLQDCQFLGGSVSASGQTVLSTNCLFQRVKLNVSSDVTGDIVSNYFCNDLFWQGEVSFDHESFDTGAWTFRDNLFDQSSNSVSHSSGSDIFANNAYVTNFTRLDTNGSDIILTNSPAYEPGTLGDFYYPTNLTNLIFKGSRSAGNAGLYHYTVTTNNIIDGANTVSIGFHYVATDTNGVPLDSNGDGTPDYIEDSNCDGLVDGTETNWALAILTQPQNIRVLDGGTGTFSVGADGVGPISYQWKFDGTNISGATNSVLNLTNVLLTNAGSYTVTVSSAFGTVPSSNATLTITLGAETLVPLPPEALWSSLVNLRPGSNETVTLNPPLFSWFYSPTNPAYSSFDSNIYFFRFQVSYTSNFSTLVTDVWTPSCCYNFLAPFASSPVYWRVAYLNANGTTNSWITNEFHFPGDSTNGVAQWDRSMLASSSYLSSKATHPYLLFNSANAASLYSFLVTNNPVYLGQLVGYAAAGTNSAYWTNPVPWGASPSGVEDRAVAIASAAFLWQTTGTNLWTNQLATNFDNLVNCFVQSGLGGSRDGFDTDYGNSGNNNIWVKSLAYAYDWLYPILTTQERTNAQAALDRVIRVSLYNFFYVTTTNTATSGFPEGNFDSTSVYAPRIGCRTQRLLINWAAVMAGL